jgi:hypothetical protein
MRNRGSSRRANLMWASDLRRQLAKLRRSLRGIGGTGRSSGVW